MTEKAAQIQTAQEAANTAETKVKGTMVRILRWINGRICSTGGPGNSRFFN